MDIRDAKPVGTECVDCHGNVNVLLEGWTAGGHEQQQPWTCPRCGAANTIVVSGQVVGTAYTRLTVAPPN